MESVPHNPSIQADHWVHRHTVTGKPGERATGVMHYECIETYPKSKSQHPVRISVPAPVCVPGGGAEASPDTKPQTQPKNNKIAVNGPSNQHKWRTVPGTRLPVSSQTSHAKHHFATNRHQLAGGAENTI